MAIDIGKALSSLLPGAVSLIPGAGPLATLGANFFSGLLAGQFNKDKPLENPRDAQTITSRATETPNSVDFNTVA